ncbi:MAG: hypothetical protein IT470_07595, partial [Pseudomonadales bacterium]|nr:hypothetical protein [Pseudomonadales bacterium]
TRIEYDGADSFLRVVVKPSAQLDRAQHLLLVFRAEAKVPPSAAPATSEPASSPAARESAAHATQP